MKTKKSFLVLMTIVLVFALVFTACSDGGSGGNNSNGDNDGKTEKPGTSGTDTALNGTWVWVNTNGNESADFSIEVKFNNGNWEVSVKFPSYTGPYQKGAYTTNGNKMTITPTHIHGGNIIANGGTGFESKWYTKSELRPLLVAYYEALIQENAQAHAEIGDDVGAYVDANLNENFKAQTTTYSISGNKLTFTMTINDETVTETYTKK